MAQATEKMRGSMADLHKSVELDLVHGLFFSNSVVFFSLIMLVVIVSAHP